MPRVRKPVLESPPAKRQKNSMKFPSENRSPWNDVNVPLALYVAPWIKAKLGLKCKTTEEYLAEMDKKQ